jgi:tetratricopeptide (TPR) repeat protein
LAEALLDRGKIEEAEAATVAVFNRLPDEPRASMVLARIATARGEWSTVLTRTEPIRNDPSARKRAAMMRADALRRLGRAGEADAEVIRADRLPEDTAWTDRFVKEVLDLRVGGDVALDRGRDLLQAGNPREAVAILETAVEKSRNPTPARLLLSRALNETRNPLAARRVIDEILRTDPNAVEGWFQLGVSQLLTKDNAAAIDSFEQVVKLKPDHTLGYFNMGLARKELGDRPGAEAAFEAALRCRPDHEPSRQALAELRGKK